MAIVEHGSVRVEVDEHGFMAKPEEWNHDVALALASTEGVAALTPKHWTLVNYIRDHYLQFGVAPMIRRLCKETRTPLKEVYVLFRGGPAKGVCKVAGLPNAAGCV
jgi:tRNA 2-thiouridine synthesizing protein E